MTLAPLSQFLIAELLCCDQLSDAAEALARIESEDGDPLSQRLYDYLQLHEAWCVRSARRMGFAMTAELQRVRAVKAKWEARMKR